MDESQASAMTGMLAGKVAVITGGGSGIGRAASLLFAQEGARVLIGDLTDRDDTAGEIRAKGGTAAFQVTDVRSESDVEALLDAAISRWGRVDVLFSNAGVSLRADVPDITGEQFDDLFATNVKGTFFGCKYAIPLMLRSGGGSIVTMSSNGGVIGRSNDPLYCASKHAVVGLTKALAVRYASENIRVNALCPGPIDTPMLRKGLSTEEEFRERLPALLCSCPAARCGTADEVAQAALFLASDRSAFITGVALPVDGGKGAGVMPNDRYRLDFEINA